MGKQRKSGLSTLDLHRLELACQPVWRAFGATYLVGTAQTGGKYRDVDVRTILSDDDFDRRFGFGIEGKTDGEAFWALVCSAVGRVLSEQTGLPIDYQINVRPRRTKNTKASGTPLVTPIASMRAAATPRCSCRKRKRIQHRRPRSRPTNPALSSRTTLPRAHLDRPSARRATPR